ncbi:hypothetical protein CsSME_00000981 [Camellia sinensis var. sinensis]
MNTTHVSFACLLKMNEIENVDRNGEGFAGNLFGIRLLIKTEVISLETMGDTGKISSFGLNFQIANRLRMVSKSPENSFQIRTFEKERVFHAHRVNLVICSLIHVCGVTFRGKIGN